MTFVHPAWLLSLAILLPFASSAADYTVTATADGHGSVDPSSQIVDEAATATVRIVADEGSFLTWVDGGACGAYDNGDGTWTTDPIYGDCGITAHFVVNSGDVIAQRDFDPDVVGIDALNLGIDASTLGSSVNWLTGATCHSCPDPNYHFRAASSFQVLGNFYLVFRFPMNLPEDDYGVVTDTTGGAAVSMPLHSGDIVAADSIFGFPVSIDGSSAWRSSAGVDAYIGFRFLDTRSGRIDYGYARLVTGAGPSGFPAKIVGYRYDRRGNPIAIP